MPIDPADGQVWFTESGLRFGPFAPASIWEVEASPLYASLAGNSQPRAVEAVVLRSPPRQRPRVVFLEAKSSAPWGPRPTDTDARRKEKQEEVEDFDREICEKLLHSLHLWLGAAHGWWPSPVPLPAQLTAGAAPMAAVDLSLVLVVSKLPNLEACQVLHHRLDKKLQRLTWALPQGKVHLVVIDAATAACRRWCAPLTT